MPTSLLPLSTETCPALASPAARRVGTSSVGTSSVGTSSVGTSSVGTSSVGTSAIGRAGATAAAAQKGASGRLRALSPAATRLLGPEAAERLSESGRLARRDDARAAASASWLRPAVEVSDSWRRPTTTDDPDGAMLESGRAERAVGRERLLPFELLLAQAGGALPLFRAGPFDELAYVQRTLTAPSHDFEFLVRLDPRNHGSERFQPFGVLRLADARPLPDLRARCATHADGTDGPLPLPSGRIGSPADGPGRLAGRAGPHASAGGGAGGVEVARRALDGLELVAWAELAFTARPEPGRVVHRYYLDRHLGAWLVRDHWRDGKRAVRAVGSADRTSGLIVYVDAARRAA